MFHAFSHDCQIHVRDWSLAKLQIFADEPYGKYAL